MKDFILILLIVALASASCVCPFMCEGGYDGNEAQCFCFCESEAKSTGSSQGTCSYFPSGEFSTGGCSFCYQSSEQKELELPENAKVVTIDDNLGDDTPLFPVEVCYCSDGMCAGYTGDYDGCMAWAKSIASRFINGQYTVTFFPWGDFSTGGWYVIYSVSLLLMDEANCPPGKPNSHKISFASIALPVVMRIHVKSNSSSFPESRRIFISPNPKK